ncbi:M64 family metallopeptidase [Actomonas aquatica]|uniref:M64 family metallopeptidase n=1 Tax=Actomonas aquatica TaxID=2866162 RepID=A0ABZ1C2T7_9BACT|nr:M64 family metallopeptidase [Opitutus sp. WL0086]WRQ85670.1 M64 family metallopeptidase [Opitutus sp. WL0086]
MSASLPPPSRLRHHWLSRLLLTGLLASLVSAQTITVRNLRDTGPSANRLNVVILGDGFTGAQETAFFNEATWALSAIVNDPALQPFYEYINATAIFTESAEAGTRIPAENLTPDTYFGASFTDGDDSRLVYIQNSAGQSKVYDLLLQHVPDYDYVVLLINSTRYGGAGGFPMTATLHSSSAEILLHESGHSFAGLTDEYVDEANADYYPIAEFANSTSNPTRESLPWRKFVDDGTPIPTTSSFSTAITSIGAYEGSHYRSTGQFRPVYDSKMRSLNRPWGAVNLRAFSESVHALNLEQATELPDIISEPDPSLYTPGSLLSFYVNASSPGPLSYQWIKDGRYLPEAQSLSLDLGVVSALEYGVYTVEITNAVGTTTSRAIALDANGARFLEDDPAPSDPNGRLTNLSVLSIAGSGEQTLTLGFAVDNALDGATKQLLVRAIGPGLSRFEVPNTIGDPFLTVAPLGSSTSETNDNWGGSSEFANIFAMVGAFALEDAASTDSVLRVTAPKLPHTAQVSNRLLSTGRALIEVYDLDGLSSPRLVNLSARSALSPGAPSLVGGFVYEGSAPKRFLIRAVGPSLSQFNIGNPLPDPTLTIHSALTGSVVATNDDWNGDDALAAAFDSVGAFGFSDTTSADSALIIELANGPYTATISPAPGSDTSGTVLIEVYELP